jgi:hypothetical protein
VNSLKSVDQGGLKKHLLNIWLRLRRKFGVLRLGSRLAGLRHEGLHWRHRHGHGLRSLNTCVRWAIWLNLLVHLMGCLVIGVFWRCLRIIADLIENSNSELAN